MYCTLDYIFIFITTVLVAVLLICMFEFAFFLLFFLQWTVEDLPKMCPTLEYFGPELLDKTVEVLGQFCLLGEAAAVRHTPKFLEIALWEAGVGAVRISAMKVCEGVC